MPKPELGERGAEMQQQILQLQQRIQGKKIAFIGAGVSHKELIGLFCRLGAKVTLCDKKASLEEFGEFGLELQQYGVALSLGQDYMQGFAGQDMILRTPGFEYYTPQLQQAKQQGIEITSEMELFFELCPCKKIAVTGSDGKTTTTSLIAEMLRQEGKRVHLGGNIGRALLPIVGEIAPEDWAVVELSSFQLISMKQSPDIAVVTNVTPNHLDHHKDMQEYVDAKRNILLYQGQNSKAVLGWENPITRQMQQDAKGSLHWFSRLNPVQEGAFLNQEGWLCMAEGGKITPVVQQSAIKLRGVHNVENMLTAIAAVWGLVSVQTIQQVATTFAGVEHRIEFVRSHKGVQWYNDSIASSPTRTIAGLRSFDQKLILIAGGYDKKIPYQPLVPELFAHVKHLILMGDTGKILWQLVEQDPNFAQSGLTLHRADQMEQAVQQAEQIAQEGDIVCLSPAAASFDKYPNFEVRGRHFKELVNQL